MHATDGCRLCGSSEQLILLWDGNSYCESCVASASPYLVKAARESGTLREEMPDYSEEMMRNIVRTGLFTVAAAVGACLLIGICTDGFRGLLVSLVAGVVPVIVPGLLVTWVLARGARRLLVEVRPTVSVTNGVVSIERESGVVSFPLTQACWRNGRLRAEQLVQTVGPQSVLLVPDREVVLLSACDRQEHLPNCVPVGFSNATASLWRAFLTISGVPRAEANA